MKKSNRGKRTAPGFTLIEVMISMGLVTLLALAVFSMHTLTTENKVAINNAFQGDQFRKEVVSLLTNPTAWRHTLQNNATFTCVVKGTDCYNALNNGPPANTFSISVMTNDIATGSPCVAGSTSCHGGFDVYDVQGVTAFYPFASDTTRGFQFNGTQCGLGIGNGTGWTGTASGSVSTGTVSQTLNTSSSSCPFRLVLWWVPVCPSTLDTTTPCTNPVVNVKGYLLYTPNPKDPYAKGAVNPANYGINLMLEPYYNK